MPGMPIEKDTLSMDMKVAILSGVFTNVNTTIKDIVPAYSSGNCTFPAYQSPALCISAADVSSHLQIVEKDDSRQWCLTPGVCTGYPEKFNIMTAANNFKDEDVDTLKYNSIAFADHVTPVGDFYVFYQNITMDKPQDNWAAAEFVIDWCIPTFSKNMINGTAITMRRPQPFIAFEIGPENITGNPDGGVPNDYNTFTIDQWTHDTLQYYIALTFSGQANFSGGGVGTYMGSDVSQQIANTYKYIDGQPINPKFTSAMGFARLNNLFNNVATSMTNYIRISAPYNTNATGTVSAQHTIVQVDRRFLAAPIVFSAASVLFFLTVVMLSSGSGGRPATKPPLWKSNVVPAMRCLDPALQHDLGGPPGHTSSLEDDEQQHVRLVRERDGWLLVRDASCAGDVADVGAGVALGNQREQQKASNFVSEKGPPSSIET